MFRFFKINDPYRLIAIFIIAFAIKLPFLLDRSDYFAMHHWLIIGEAMRSGTMYEHIFDTMAPLAATVYWFIDVLFGRSVLALHILGTLLMVAQAVIFNNLTINNKVFEQNSYLPAFVFTILSSLHFSQTVLAPAQLGMTFILLAFSKLLSHVEFRAKRDEQIMSIGLLIGIAALFYLPYIMFLPIVLIILLIFTSTLRRRYFILIINTFIPPILVFTYYALIHSAPGYVFMNFGRPVMTLDFSIFNQAWDHILLFLPLLLAWLLGFVTMPNQRRLNNYQNRLAQLFFITGLLSLGIIIFADTGLDTVLIIITPVAAFFATHLFMLIKKPVKDLAVSVVFLALVLFTGFDSVYGIVGLVSKIEKEIKVDPGLVALIKDKKIMVLGDKPELYQYGSLATPFYNWSLARPIVEHLTYYDNLVFIKNSLDKHQPDIIIDYELRWAKFVYHIPVLKNQYEQVRPFVWQRIAP